VLNAADYQAIRIERQGRVAVLTLDRPDRLNAVDDVMHSELSTVFADAQRDPDVNVVVLTGAGRAFSAGGDTAIERAYRTKTGRTVIEEARHIVDDVIDLEKPFIAAVNGHAIGLGATLATLADVSFLAEGAKIGDPHVLAALPAGNGSGVIWPLLVGLNRAKHLLMTGELLSAGEAERFGLVTRVLPAAEVLPAALTLAARFDAMAPQAVRGTKIAINRILRQVSDAMLPLSLALEDAAMHHPDFAAALRALSERSD
jgi:enoyl-CoA hydratase/carnithine racemase